MRILLLSCVSLQAQTVDTAIVGTVTDNTGAVVPGATVTISYPATGLVKNVVTSSSGEYSVTYLSSPWLKSAVDAAQDWIQSV